MIVGIDATVAVTPPLSGVGYHILRLLEQVDRIAPADFEFRLFYARSHPDADTLARRLLPASTRMRPVGVPFLRGRGIAYELHRRFTLPLAIRLQRCDLFHGPAHILPRSWGIPTVVTIHDLAFFDHELYSPGHTAALREVVGTSIAQATAVIALSEHTRRDIQRIASRVDGVEVIYGAGNYPTDSERAPHPGDPRTLDQMGILGRYVLYVGDFNPRKNLGYLVESFGALRRQIGFEDVRLVLAGHSAKAREDLLAKAASVGLGPLDVILPGRVSDEQLRVLYRNAAAFALCSLLEGFTLVTLEAMSYGVPVVATNTSSIAEGTGNAAELVPLDQPAAVASALATALGHGPRREEMRRLGLERVQRFTWEAAARHTLQVYKRSVRLTR